MPSAAGLGDIRQCCHGGLSPQPGGAPGPGAAVARAVPGTERPNAELHGAQLAPRRGAAVGPTKTAPEIRQGCAAWVGAAGMGARGLHGAATVGWEPVGEGGCGAGAAPCSGRKRRRKPRAARPLCSPALGQRGRWGNGASLLAPLLPGRTRLPGETEARRGHGRRRGGSGAPPRSAQRCSALLSARVNAHACVPGGEGRSCPSAALVAGRRQADGGCGRCSPRSGVTSCGSSGCFHTSPGRGRTRRRHGEL